jgi:hypothetical protein
MANVIQFIDGFDHYQPSSEWFYKWEMYSGSLPNQVTGRFSSGQAIRFSTSNWVRKQFTTYSAAWRLGMAVYIDTSSGSNDCTLIQLKEDGTSHIELWIDRNLKLRVNRNGTQVGSVSTNAMPFQTWFYLEWYIVCTDSLSNGHCTVKINGTTELNITSGDTRNGGSGTPNWVYIGGGNFWNVYIDDLVMTSMDTTTTPTFLGDRRVVTLYPSGDGNHSQFVGSDGNSTNNSLLVDEASDINLTDYVESATAGNRDSYAMDNVSPAPATVHAVQVCVTGAKPDAGIRTGKSFVRISGTNYDSSTFYPSSSPRTHYNLMETSPATASAWTSTELNGLEAGVKVEA